MTSLTNPAQAEPAGSENPSHRSSWIPGPLPAALLCFVLSLAMHLPWLGITPIAGTEGHRIFPAHTMVQTHWWLVPLLFDQPYMTKPPLHLWFIAASEIIAGKGSPFVWRLPSVITGAALCAAACLFAARWFGRTAGLISGMCVVGLVTIWGQSQVADIDSSNTLFAVLTAFCGIELFIARPARQWAWIIAAGAAFAAMWMVKGPAGLPIVLGVWIHGAFVAARERRGKVALEETPIAQSVQQATLNVHAFWVPWVIALGVFITWGLLARHSVHVHGKVQDPRGLQEGASKLYPASIKILLTSIFAMLPQVALFGLPVSAALPFAFRRDIEQAVDAREWRILRACAISVLISWGICVASGMINPRYAYPTLIPLCPLSGAVAVAGVRSRRAGDWVRGIAIGSAVALNIAAVALAIMARQHPWVPLLIASAIACTVVACVTIRRLLRSWDGAWGLVVVALLCSIPFGIQRHVARVKDSGLGTAPLVRKIVGENGWVACGGVITSKPETFVYANVRVHYYPFRFIPQNVPAPTWVILDNVERRLWHRTTGIHLEREQALCRFGRTDYVIAWYAGIDSPATTPGSN